MYQNIYYQREKNLIHLWDDQQGYRSFPYTRYAYEPAQRGEYTSIYGDKLTKIYKFKKDDPNLFESDVPETTRALVDLYSDSDDISEGHVVLTYDIECEMESGLPDPQEAKNALTSIALHDSATNQYWVLVMDASGKMVEKTTDKAIVIPFTDERDMLMKYLELYEMINPSIVTGWNIDYFDTPMLYNRIKRLLGERQANRLSPIGQCFWSPYRKRYFMAGVSYLDYLALYKNFTSTELDSYRLDSVAQKELDRKKIEYDGNLDILFETDIEKFIEYNLVDVELVVEFDRKLKFIDTARGICHAGHVPYEDFVYSSKYLEGALKLKEISYIHAEGYPAAEMKHGPIALVDPLTPSVFLIPKDGVYEKVILNLEEIKARKGPVIAVVSKGDDRVSELADEVIELPACPDFLNPIVASIPLQLLAYHIACFRGCDVDKPRNLAKSVTVE